MTLFSCFFPHAYRADEDHYLVIRYLDGRREHITGPVQAFFNSWKHERITVEAHRRHVATESQCLDVVYRSGRFERILGPSTVTFDPLEHEKIDVRALTRHIAGPGEYLVVQYCDGRKDHLKGPQEICFHPLEHESISKHEALRLAANEAVVVYRRVKQSEEAELVAKLEVAKPRTNGKALIELDTAVEGVPQPSSAPGTPPLLTTEAAGQEGAMHVERRVVHGPAVFIPDHNEWLHTFSWHGSKNADGKGSKTGFAGDVKVPHALNFTVIRCMPDSMYLSVRDVRTIDDANLTVHLMMFYELQSIETMLDSTNDMIGDFVNAASADVMTFASRLTYETFLQDTAELSKVANFPILASRMKQTGNQLQKVVYRGYGASAQLQEMHDQAISRRTKLRLESDAAREEQEKRAMELRCRRDRSVQEQELEAAATKHKLEVQAMSTAQNRKVEEEDRTLELKHEKEVEQMKLANARARHEAQLQCEKENGEVRVAQLAAEAQAELAKYKGLKEMGVDLTAYLVALAAQMPDQHIKLEHGGQPNPPTVHLELPKAVPKRH